MPIHRNENGELVMTPKWKHNQRCGYCATLNIMADRKVDGREGCRHFRGGKTKDKRGR